MKSPEQGESVAVPSFISLYDNCGTAGAAPLADPSAAQHMYFLVSDLSAPNFPAQERILRRSDFSERWKSSARLSRRESLQGGAQHQTCFMSDTHEPTTRLANGLSSSIWTSINCTFCISGQGKRFVFRET